VVRRVSCPTGIALKSRRETTTVQSASSLQHQKKKVRLHLPCDQRSDGLIRRHFVSTFLTRSCTGRYRATSRQHASSKATSDGLDAQQNQARGPWTGSPLAFRRFHAPDAQSSAHLLENLRGTPTAQFPMPNHAVVWQVVKPANAQ
jgi:hypothetical protein